MVLVVLIVFMFIKLDGVLGFLDYMKEECCKLVINFRLLVLKFGNVEC